MLKEAVSCKGTYKHTHANQLDLMTPEMHQNDCAALSDDIAKLCPMSSLNVSFHESPCNVIYAKFLHGVWLHGGLYEPQ